MKLRPFLISLALLPLLDASAPDGEAQMVRLGGVERAEVGEGHAHAHQQRDQQVHALRLHRLYRAAEARLLRLVRQRNNNRRVVDTGILRDKYP